MWLQKSSHRDSDKMMERTNASTAQALKTLECYCAKFSGFLRPDTDERLVIMFKRSWVSPEKLLNPLRSTWSTDRDQWRRSTEPTSTWRKETHCDSGVKHVNYSSEWRTTTIRKIQAAGEETFFYGFSGSMWTCFRWTVSYSWWECKWCSYSPAAVIKTTSAQMTRSYFSSSVRFLNYIVCLHHIDIYIKTSVANEAEVIMCVLIATLRPLRAKRKNNQQSDGTTGEQLNCAT